MHADVKLARPLRVVPKSLLRGRCYPKIIQRTTAIGALEERERFKRDARSCNPRPISTLPISTLSVLDELYAEVERF